jgi:thiamine-monophosphate kinase
VVHYDAIPRAEAFHALGDAQLEKDCVLSGGDDYELLFTVSRERRKEVESLSRELAIALTRIGSIRTGEPKLVVMDSEHKPMSFRSGFDHFAGR